PQAADDLHALGEPAHPLGDSYAEDGELLPAIAQPDAKREPPPGGHVEKGGDLRDLDGIVQGEQDQVGAEGEALRLRGQALQHGQQREVVEARRGVVLAAPDRVEAERADHARLLERLREAARGVVADGMLRVQIHPELHGPWDGMRSYERETIPRGQRCPRRRRRRRRSGPSTRGRGPSSSPIPGTRAPRGSSRASASRHWPPPAWVSRTWRARATAAMRTAAPRCSPTAA